MVEAREEHDDSQHPKNTTHNGACQAQSKTIIQRWWEVRGRAIKLVWGDQFAPPPPYNQGKAEAIEIVERYQKLAAVSQGACAPNEQCSE